GEEELKATETSISYEKTYGMLNTFLMAVGGLATIGGLITLTTESDEEKEIKKRINRLSLNLNNGRFDFAYSKSF
ncbi:MAG: hypothetical protein ACOC2U_05345, partial [bacterium]